jgi:hypothetical protein
MLQSYCYSLSVAKLLAIASADTISTGIVGNACMHYCTAQRLPFKQVASVGWGYLGCLEKGRSTGI